MKWMIALMAALAGPALAHDYSIGALSVNHPFAGETASMAQAGAGYFTITNTGDSDDTLLEVEADFPRVMMHQTVMQGDMATMPHLMAVPIPVGETVVFAPGGKHVMFMGLGGDPFEIGEEIPATLVFENAGRLDVVFKVEALDSADHSNH